MPTIDISMLFIAVEIPKSEVFPFYPHTYSESLSDGKTTEWRDVWLGTENSFSIKIEKSCPKKQSW